MEEKIIFDEIGDSYQPDHTGNGHKGDVQEFRCPYCKKPLSTHKGSITFSSKHNNQ